MCWCAYCMECAARMPAAIECAMRLLLSALTRLLPMQPRAPCVLAELVDERHRHGDDGEDGEEGGGGLGKRGRGRGRPAVLDVPGVGASATEVERVEDPLVFCPLLKYEGSGRLLDLAPDAQLEEGAAEPRADAAGLKVVFVPFVIRACSALRTHAFNEGF